MRKTSIVKPILADVNVWLATLVAEHPHHEPANRWWRTEVLPDGDHVAFCRLTQLGLLRLLSSERVMGRQRMDHVQAWTPVATLQHRQMSTFWMSRPVSTRTSRISADGAESSPSFWSDAYLAAFALAGRHRIATFDRGFRRFEDLRLILLTDSGDAPHCSDLTGATRSARRTGLDPVIRTRSSAPTSSARRTS